MTIRKSRTVLVVDDDRHTLDFVTECLRQMGQDVYSAASGEEALDIINKLKVNIDLLLSDVVMPGINGIDLAKTMTTGATATKVIFMSGYMKPSLPEANSPQYEKGFIQKPFSGKTLITHVKKALAELS